MDALVGPVLARMDPKVQAVVERRQQMHGDVQARIHAEFSFTDDVVLLAVGAECSALSTDTWGKVCYKCNFAMTDFVKRSVVTAPLHIGARFVLNAHFGCVPPVKRTRCLQGIRAALERGRSSDRALFCGVSQSSLRRRRARPRSANGGVSAPRSL